MNEPAADWPKVSVVVPCKNMGAYVGDAIRSALAQTRPPFEIIVVDDGSTDDTRDVVRAFGAPVQLLNGPGRGSAISRNIAILAARGEYIAFLDADDLWYPQHLELQIDRMRAEGRAFSFSDFHRTADPARPGQGMHAGYTKLAEGKVFANLLHENFVPTSSAIVRKDLLAETGLFKPQLRGGQDFDLWLRIARRAEFTWLRPCLVFLRHHDGNISSSSNYPYMNARLWEEIQREHADCEPAERRYIRRRLARELYDTGRHAIREQKFSLAHGYFWRALRHGNGLRALPWLLISCAPAPLVSWLLRVKRTLSRSAAAADGGAANAGLPPSP
jgi:glycosyltransferase involved in cell wall biosynthesis